MIAAATRVPFPAETVWGAERDCLIESTSRGRNAEQPALESDWQPTAVDEIDCGVVGMGFHRGTLLM